MLTKQQLTWAAYLRKTHRLGCDFLPADVATPTPLYAGAELSKTAQMLNRFFGINPYRPEPGAVARHLDALSELGFRIPETWLKDDPQEHLPTLNHLEALHRHFPLADYLVTFQECIGRPVVSEYSHGVVALYHYLPAYLTLLRRARRNVAIHPRRTDGRLLSERLHAEQLTEILLMAIRYRYGGYETEVELKRFVATASPAVQVFCKDRLPGLLKAVTRALNRQPYDFDSEEGGETDGWHDPQLLGATEKHFYDTCASDVDTLLLRRVFRHPAAFPAPDERTQALVQSHLAAAPPAGSVFARIAAFSPGTAPASAPTDRKADAIVAALTPEDRDLLLAHYRGNDALALAARQEYATLTAGLLNRFTAPRLTWSSDEGEAHPVFEAYDNADDLALHQLQSTQWKLELYEEKQLASQAKLLDDISDHATLDREAGKVDFHSPEMQQRYGRFVEKRRAALDEVNRYRNEKLREYGIVDPHLKDITKDLYLDEILRIEKEVTPFIPFVQDAFRAALPIKSKLDFNAGRHSIDGPEFDPDTLAVPEKYLRGEVMKTFREDRRAVPIAQVNAFCLDYSKSMTHEPMRDLFKLMFLLILGLEGRGTYDAVYFFGNDFMEVADFDGLTNRKLLWPILRTISQITSYQVKYGGNGYTNISQGLDESHVHLLEYAKMLKSKHPDVHLVKSIFMLTDGEPNAGIWAVDQLRDHIEAKREDGDVAIKGIYLDTGSHVGDTVQEIFGYGHTVASNDFESAVINFVHIMSETYKAQRSRYRRERRTRKALNQ